jgi:hypothetical protein
VVSRKRDTHTPNRVVRVEDELWDAAKAKAAERGETVSDAVRRALKRYVASKPPRRPE